ncbi:hypothetical protein ACFFRR_004301 [Megaselia abdita]
MIKSTILCSVAILASVAIVQGCFLRSRMDPAGEHICCPGYNKNLGGECVKSCNDCNENGICIGTGHCMCIYGTGDKGCLSFCDSRCKNGSCILGKCQCNSGFQAVRTLNLMRAFLYDEYDDDSDEIEECVPICKNCHFGICISPDECKCKDGFKKGETGSCQPDCSDCEHGLCVAPGECKCMIGYKRINNTCVPQCFGNCPEGKCVRPGICECGEGFKWSYFTETCMAQCITLPCKANEQCMSSTTGKCECKTGYKRNMRTLDCEPICDDVCVNGFCSAPNKCSCNTNFTHRNGTYCEPKCEPSCPLDSVCSNGTCECNSGYYNVSGICERFCDCKNGFCSESDGTCICLSGYLSNPKNSSECLPKCEVEGCENGFCDHLGECICHSHHQKNSSGKCVKCEEGSTCNGEFVPYTCNPKCKYGICFEKDICVCHHGYDKTEESHVCEPICHGGCMNGVCNSPNNCTCNEGYEQVNDKCQPTCVHQCINGICSEPNVCKCAEGHEFVPNSEHKCEKKKEVSNEMSIESASENSGNIGFGIWIIVVCCVMALVAATFGVIWYTKTRRNASFPLIENFVYNRMSE